MMLKSLFTTAPAVLYVVTRNVVELCELSV
jgi:hypothetical protein